MAELQAMHAEVQVGDTLSAWTAPPITRHALALYCGASGDHNPIHVDIDFARAAGMTDVFAHGMLGMAYLGHVLSLAAPIQALRSYGVRFVAIIHIGDALQCHARVGEIVERDGERIAKLSLWATGPHQQVKLQGDAELSLDAIAASRAND